MVLIADDSYDGNCGNDGADDGGNDLYGFVFQVVCCTMKQIIHKLFNEVTDMRKN